MRIMDKILEIFSDTIDKENYSKILKLTPIVVILLAPSISIIFLYKREMFMEMEFTKLILIGIVVNIIFFISVYTILKLLSNLRVVLKDYQNKIAIKEINNNIEQLKQSPHGSLEEIEKEEDKIKKILDSVKNHTIETIKRSGLLIYIFTITIWIFYFVDIIGNRRLSDELAILRLVGCVIAYFYLGVVGNIVYIFKYCKNIKVPFREITGKEYKKRKDKSLWFNIIFMIALVVYTIFLII